MGWSVGYGDNWKRDIGYGVPAYCDYPGCDQLIDRGLTHVCGGQPYGEPRGCGLYFCRKHLHEYSKLPPLCDRCAPRIRKPYPAKPDHPSWIYHKLTDPSWEAWRDDNPKEVSQLTLSLNQINIVTITSLPEDFLLMLDTSIPTTQATPFVCYYSGEIFKGKVSFVDGKPVIELERPLDNDPVWPLI